MPAHQLPNVRQVENARWLAPSSLSGDNDAADRMAVTIVAALFGVVAAPALAQNSDRHRPQPRP